MRTIAAIFILAGLIPMQDATPRRGGWLGMMLRDLPGGAGVKVEFVLPGSGAEELGFKAGDILPGTIDGLLQAVVGKAEVPITLQRGEGEQTIQASLAAFDARPRIVEKGTTFTLRTPDGEDEIALADLVGEKPVVLIFGSASSPEFAAQAAQLRKMHRKFGERAEFLLVYTRELKGADPATIEDRRQAALKCLDALQLSMPAVVDGMDDAVSLAYGGWAGRVLILDRKGRIAWKSPPGPGGLKGRDFTKVIREAVEDRPGRKRWV